jgi:hypothetical protein
MDSHTHTFAESDWPFGDPIKTLAYTTTRVLRDGYPVLLVSHDHDGDWQFLCDTTNRVEDCLVVCLGCAFQRDQSVRPLADLPTGWQARRESIAGSWERYPIEPEDEG